MAESQSTWREASLHGGNHGQLKNLKFKLKIKINLQISQYAVIKLSHANHRRKGGQRFTSAAEEKCFSYQPQKSPTNCKSG